MSTGSRIADSLRVIALVTLASSALAQESGKDPEARLPAGIVLADYDGKYEQRGPFKRMLDKLPQMCHASLKRIEQRLGLVSGERGIRIELRDALAADADPITRFSGTPFRTRWEGDDVGILLHAEFLANGRFEVDTELLHELTHAVMRSHMSAAGYKLVPEWVREGLAVWTADQIKDKAVYLVRRQRKPANDESLLPGLESGPETLERYAEYGLAIEMIEKRHGAAAVKSLVRQVVEGTPARKAVEQVTQQSWDAFAAAAREYARQRLEEIAPPEIGLYFEMLEADKQRDYQAVIEKSAKLLRTGAASPLRDSTLYFRGKAFRMLGKRGDAEKALKDLIARGDRGSEWIEGALYQIAKARVEGEKYQEAIDPLQRLLRDHPDSEHQDNVLYYLALCRGKTGKKADARKLLDLFERSFPQSEYKDKAGELRRTLGP